MARVLYVVGVCSGRPLRPNSVCALGLLLDELCRLRAFLAPIASAIGLVLVGGPGVISVWRIVLTFGQGAGRG
jgi:hypothetical protein